ncbi:hypothetical protein [Leifsonia poae]|uniref:hypothetical protein n=1 Tax=Leifsonia poae TaxID=110933 RepID=UPI001CBC6F60|nr:hypothetical protein [Leifsonia poae]
MVITVVDDSQALLELLWIREAWRLRPKGRDLPPALADRPALVSAPQRSAAPIVEWQQEWPVIWEAALLHAGTPQSLDVFDRLNNSAIGSDERARILRELVGPSWRERFGSDAMAEDAEQWRSTLLGLRMNRTPPTPEEQPEHAALGELIEAWRAGLTIIVEIPCSGPFTRRLGTHAILVTAETRADPQRYRAALAEFR